MQEVRIYYETILICGKEFFAFVQLYILTRLQPTIVDQYGVYKLDEAHSHSDHIFAVKAEINARGPVTGM